MFALRLLHRCAPVAALGVALALPAWDAEAAPNNRLDHDVLPTAQSLRLKLDPSLPDYSGETHLDLQVVTSTTSFRLYAKDMDLFRVPVTVPAADAAVSNTPIEKEKTVGGLKTVDFARTPPLPSYLVAIAAGPFEFVPIPGMSVPGRVVTVKGSSRLAGEAVRATPPILGALEKYFGRPYPYAKLDLIAVPEFSAGAMENAGAVT